MIAGRRLARHETSSRKGLGNRKLEQGFRVCGSGLKQMCSGCAPIWRVTSRVGCGTWMVSRIEGELVSDPRRPAHTYEVAKYSNSRSEPQMDACMDHVVVSRRILPNPEAASRA